MNTPSETVAHVAGVSPIGGNGHTPVPADHCIIGFTLQVALGDLWSDLGPYQFEFPHMNIEMVGRDGRTYCGPDFSLS